MAKSHTSKSLIDKTIQFCNEIATLFDENQKEKLPNFISYCSKTAKTPVALASLSFLYRIDKNFGKIVFDFMSKKHTENVNEATPSGRKRLHRSLDAFFEKDTKEKFLITFSSLISVYLDAHKTFQLHNNNKYSHHSFLLEYIDILATEMLDPYHINLEGIKRKSVKIAPAKNFETICESSVDSKGNKRKRCKVESSKAKIEEKKIAKLEPTEINENAEIC